MTKVVNSKNLERSSARWYDSEDPSNRTIAVHMHKGALSISTRNHPSEVWSPHKQMFLDASIDVPAAVTTHDDPQCCELYPDCFHVVQSA